MGFIGTAICNNCGFDAIWIGDDRTCPVCGACLITPNIGTDAYFMMPNDQREEYKKALRNNAELEPSLVAKRIAYEAEQSVKSSVPSTPKPKCPTCSSTNVHKISAGERVASVGLFGLFSKKINKTFKCKDCGYSW